MATQYPECEKLSNISDQSQLIGNFLEWASGTQEFHMCIYSGHSEEYLPIGMATERLLAKFFKINLDKVEEERRQMLDEVRKSNATKNG